MNQINIRRKIPNSFCWEKILFGSHLCFLSHDRESKDVGFKKRLPNWDQLICEVCEYNSLKRKNQIPTFITFQYDAHHLWRPSLITPITFVPPWDNVTCTYFAQHEEGSSGGMSVTWWCTGFFKWVINIGQSLYICSFKYSHNRKSQMINSGDL